LIGDPVPGAAVEAKKGTAWVRRSFENLLDLRREAGEFIFPCIRHFLFLRIVTGFVRKVEGKDVPREGLSELEVDCGLLRVQAGRKKAVAHDELVRVDAWIAAIQQARALALDGESIEQILAEGVETLVLIGREDELRGGGGVTELVQHLFGVGSVELLSQGVER
jgi:hypothetical protein